ncbi:MAG: DUF4906 domain-containing protein [Bacteroidales bacterium]|nr:DUF4906 domain-containing protein [Bacteroidales bacterium]
MQLSKITALSAIMLSAASCEKEPSVQWPCSEDADSVKLSFVSPEFRCKSGFKGNEDTISDWAVFVFDQKGAPVKYVIDGGNDINGTEIYVSRGAEYSFFILANLGDAIVSQGGYGALAGKNRDEFEGISFKPVPCDKADGIAMAWARKNYVAQHDASIQVNLKRLYAKYIISISRDKANKSEIQIKSVTVRQSRDALYPFCDNNDGEMADIGDYAMPLDIDALNRGEDIALYVPQNVVYSDCGNPRIEDQWDKDMEVLADMGYEDLCSRCTYLEITADYSLTERVSPSQLRYFHGKTATWRFILGGDSTSDFDIEGNTIYHLTLQLTDEGVFRNCWRAGLDNYSGNDCLLRWETGAGDACSANSIETICIEAPSSIREVYPKLIIDGVRDVDAGISVSFPQSPHISPKGSGFLISGKEDMAWQTFYLTATWTDADGNSLESDLKVKIRPANIGIDSMDTDQNTQNIIF